MADKVHKQGEHNSQDCTCRTTIPSKSIFLTSGVGTRGAGGAGAPLKFVKGGLSPLKWTCLYLFLVNTYLKVSLYILLAHALLYILTLQQLAMLVQRSGSRKGSTAMRSMISWILINRFADRWSLWIIMSPPNSSYASAYYLTDGCVHVGSWVTLSVSHLYISFRNVFYQISTVYS